MARATVRRNMSFAPRSNRKKIWARSQIAATVDATLQQFDLLSDLKAIQGSMFPGVTVGPIFWRFGFAVTVAPTISPAAVHMGVSVVNSAEANPHPTQDAFIDWMINTVAVVGMADASIFGSDIVNRSKRKMDEIEQRLLLSLVSNGGENSAYGVVNTLILLP